MVTAPIVLLIAVATTPDAAAVANVAAASCLQALPAGTRTVVRTMAALPDDAELGAAAASAGATATVVVTWRDAAQLVSDVRVRATWSVDDKRRQTERTVVFSARDLPAERGRALGLVIASILTEAWGGAPGGTSAAPGGAHQRPAAVVDAETPLALGAAGAATQFLRWGVDMSVITAVDAQEDFDDTIGGLIGFRRAFDARWALRLGVGFRVADLDGAAATARTTLVALGIAWTSPGFTAGRGLGLAARADLLGAHETLQRARVDDDIEDVGHWTVGADLVGDLGLGLSSGTSLLLGAGLEGFLSGESLTAPGRIPATIPRGRVIFELGVLSRF